MSTERAVPPAGASRSLKSVALAMVLVAAVAAGGLLALRRPFRSWDVASVTSPDGSHIAIVTARSCDDGSCQTLWIGASRGTAETVAALENPSSRCDEIVWTADGKRVGFLIDGYQLRLYDTSSRLPAGQVDLIERDATPTSRIARGITFSENGRAVTFDDCPRYRSGCRAGLAAVPAPDAASSSR